MLKYRESMLLIPVKLFGKYENCNGGHFYLTGYMHTRMYFTICQSTKILQTLFVQKKYLENLQSDDSSARTNIFPSLLTKGIMNLTWIRHFIDSQLHYQKPPQRPQPLTKAHLFLKLLPA